MLAGHNLAFLNNGGVQNLRFQPTQGQAFYLEALSKAVHEMRKKATRKG
jgi:hypothetical protein